MKDYLQSPVESAGHICKDLVLLAALTTCKVFFLNSGSFRLSQQNILKWTTI